MIHPEGFVDPKNAEKYASFKVHLCVKASISELEYSF
jgi:hypothetical protein